MRQFGKQCILTLYVWEMEQNHYFMTEKCMNSVIFAWKNMEFGIFRWNNQNLNPNFKTIKTAFSVLKKHQCSQPSPLSFPNIISSTHATPLKLTADSSWFYFSVVKRKELSTIKTANFSEKKIFIFCGWKEKRVQNERKNSVRGNERREANDHCWSHGSWTRKMHWNDSRGTDLASPMVKGSNSHWTGTSLCERIARTISQSNSTFVLGTTQ